jgi:DNA helicase-2/ATP-dependent DNA helicase PcrA
MLLKGLNKMQKEAVKTTEGPLLILAGAGSGKTGVLTRRVAYLIEELGIFPGQILAITFTNKAAKEMKARIVKLVGEKAYSAQISTFHSFCARVLRFDIERLGYTTSFSILDGDDQVAIVKRIMKDFNIDPKKFNPKSVTFDISSSKNELIDTIEYERYVNNPYQEVVARVYKEYEKRLKNSNSLDFNDLIGLTIKLFEENNDILEKYQNRYQYMHVDEYQDTNNAQYRLIKLLGNKHHNICVVGDSDQSIYSWRGANISNILNFEKDYPESRTILLEQNYRSTKTILDAANDVIKNNRQRKEKKLWTENEQGDKIDYYRAINERDEANYVVDNIDSYKRKGTPYNEMMIMYRTNAQSRTIEESFIREGIPYRLIGGTNFYQRREIKDVLAYLKLINNTYDDLSFQRIVNVPKRAIGATTVEKLRLFASENNMSMFQAIEQSTLPARTKTKLIAFKQMIYHFQSQLKEATLTDVVELVLDRTGYRNMYKMDKSLDALARIENIEELKSVTQTFEERYDEPTLDLFLQEISLLTDKETEEEIDDRVTLMTMHGAKGLEYDYVFIVGCEENLFPHVRSLTDESEMEEERRLAYVGITRARKKLHLTNAQIRTFFGRHQANQVSRFISEIDVKHIQLVNEKKANDNKFKKEEQYIKNETQYKSGDKIKHVKWGDGMVVGVNGDTINIAFKAPIGVKTLMANHKSITKA